MIVAIDKPQTMDAAIEKLQAWLNNNLLPIWGLIDPLQPALADLFVFYPRVYRTIDAKGGYTAMMYQGAGKDYKEVYTDDALFGQSWFGTGNKIDRAEGGTSVDVHLIVFANLVKLYPNLIHRADNEIHDDFCKILEAPLFGFTLQSIETGLANVLREYPGSRRDQRLTGADMGDWHAFRMNLTLIFSPEDYC